MSNVVKEVLWVKDNWRSVNYHSVNANPYTEVQLESGEWQYPDCGWICSHCQKCLGCVRKCINEPDDDYYIQCEESPNGLHCPATDASEE